MQINSFPYAKLKENIFRETNEKKKKFRENSYGIH